MSKPVLSCCEDTGYKYNKLSGDECYEEMPERKGCTVWQMGEDGL